MSNPTVKTKTTLYRPDRPPTPVQAQLNPTFSIPPSPKGSTLSPLHLYHPPPPSKTPKSNRSYSIQWLLFLDNKPLTHQFIHLFLPFRTFPSLLTHLNRPTQISQSTIQVHSNHPVQFIHLLRIKQHTNPTLQSHPLKFITPILPHNPGPPLSLKTQSDPNP